MRRLIHLNPFIASIVFVFLPAPNVNNQAWHHISISPPLSHLIWDALCIFFGYRGDPSFVRLSSQRLLVFHLWFYSWLMVAHQKPGDEFHTIKHTFFASTVMTAAGCESLYRACKGFVMDYILKSRLIYKKLVCYKKDQKHLDLRLCTWII